MDAPVYDNHKDDPAWLINRCSSSPVVKGQWLRTLTEIRDLPLMKTNEEDA